MGAGLWANLHFLFWLSLVPFTTGWLGENHRSAVPTAVYGIVLIMCAIGYAILEHALIQGSGDDSKLKKAVGTRRKEIVSTLCYFAAVPLAFVHPYIADALFVSVAAIWLVPDRRIEAVMRS